jgi:hypothetical protein
LKYLIRECGMGSTSQSKLHCHLKLHKWFSKGTSIKFLFPLSSQIIISMDVKTNGAFCFVTIVFCPSFGSYRVSHIPMSISAQGTNWTAKLVSLCRGYPVDTYGWNKQSLQEACKSLDQSFFERWRET